MLLDNNAPSTTGLRGYIFWGQGRDDVILGNYDAASTREHDLRTEGVDRILVAYNNFTNHDTKGTVEIHKGTYAYVVGNTLDGGPLRAGPRGGGTEPSSTATIWTVFDANRVYWHRPSTSCPAPTTSRSATTSSTTKGGSDINVSPADNEGRSISDVRIFNNTGINPASRPVLLQHRRPSLRPILMGNNLYVAPNLTPGGGGAAPVFVKMYDLSGFGGIFNNVWAGAACRGSKWAARRGELHLPQLHQPRRLADARPSGPPCPKCRGTSSPTSRWTATSPPPVPPPRPPCRWPASSRTSPASSARSPAAGRSGRCRGRRSDERKGTKTRSRTRSKTRSSGGTAPIALSPRRPNRRPDTP